MIIIKVGAINKPIIPNHCIPKYIPINETIIENIAFLIKSSDKKNNNDNSVINREDNAEEKNNSKSGKLWLIPVIVTAAVILLLFLAPRFLGMGYYGMYMFHGLDDIVEGFFQLAISIAVIVFLAVFFKKIWNKL